MKLEKELRKAYIRFKSKLEVLFPKLKSIYIFQLAKKYRATLSLIFKGANAQLDIRNRDYNLKERSENAKDIFNTN